MAATSLKYSAGMERLLNGIWVNQACGNIAREVLLQTIGPASITQNHLKKRQSSWPRLKASTLNDKRKRARRTFVRTGTVAKAIVKRPVEGKLSSWGTGTKKRQRYSASGMYSVAGVGKDGFWMMTGFSGQIKYSSALRKKRQQLALAKGVKLTGLTRGNREKAIRKAVKVGEAHDALGGSANKHAKLGKNNLAYANIVQAGPYGSNRPTRELMPYDNSDTPVIQNAIERGVQATLRAEFGGK